MTQAAVSYQIKLLEDRVGPLFLRKARGVELTDAGRRLAPTVTAAFDGLRAAFDDVRQATESVLAVTVIQTFATNWLVPRLGAFQAAHPDIAVRLDVSSRLVDFAREDFDVGIRTGHWPNLISHPLVAIEFTPMVSPRLLERFGPLDEPGDLARVPIIEPSDPWWPMWFAEAGAEAPDLARQPDIRLGTQQLAGSAAVAGQGAAILTPAFFRDELASGRLVQPFDLVGREDGSYSLVYPQSRRRSPKVRAFRDWIISAFENERAGTAD